MTIFPIPSHHSFQLPRPIFMGDENSIENCTKKAGIYALWIELDQPLTISRPRASTLPKGIYCYIGSARGPGGLKARLKRHMRQDKSVRWHIDQLTTRASAVFAWAWTDGEECALLAQLDKAPYMHHPITGFGSSDCKTCPSHLLALDETSPPLNPG